MSRKPFSRIYMLTDEVQGHVTSSLQLKMFVTDAELSQKNLYVTHKRIKKANVILGKSHPAKFNICCKQLLQKLKLAFINISIVFACNQEEVRNNAPMAKQSAMLLLTRLC